MLFVATLLEAGIAFWCLLLTVILLRYAIAEKDWGLPLATSGIFLAILANRIWLLFILRRLEQPHLVTKIIMAVFTATVITYFMWQVDFRYRVGKNGEKFRDK